MKIKAIATGPLETNCYIVSDEKTGETLVIDPADEPDRILDLCEGLTIKYIVLTHAHFDHAGAVPEVKEATGAKIAFHPSDERAYFSVAEQAALWGFESVPMPKPDILLSDGDELAVGSTTLRVIHTPGHSPGCICLLADGVLFSGDTLFLGSVGRTDLPGGSFDELRASFRRLMGLPPDTVVFPGHGPSTTINAERKGNILSGEI